MSNQAPVLSNTPSSTLTTISEDILDSNNSGTTVASIVVDGSITDADGSAVEAIAVSGVDNTNGVWQYKIGTGSWTAFDFSATQPNIVFNNINGGVVSNNPLSLTTFSVPIDTLISNIATYHWNGGSGSPTGTISLQHSDGTVYGPWVATGMVYSPWTATNSAYWNVYPDTVIKPGSYTVIDSNPATWSFDSGSGNAGFAQVLSPTIPTALLLDSTDSVRFVPNADYSGTVNAGITFYAWDKSSGSAGNYLPLNGNIGGDKSLSVNSDTASIIVTAVNDAPSLTTPYLNQGIAYGTQWTYNLNLSSHFSDPDNDTLLYTATLYNGVALPSWLHFNATTGILSGIAPSKMLGQSLPIHITATDSSGSGSSVGASFTVTVLDFNAGNLFFSTTAAETITGASGIDTVSYKNAPPSGDADDTLIDIKNVIGSDYADTLTDNTSIDNSTLAGGSGNDIYYISNPTTKIIENINGGIDEVQSSVDYDLSKTKNVEKLTLLSPDVGSLPIKAIGANKNEYLKGNSADNILDGKAGADTMEGGTGNDTYYVDNIGDVIYEDSAHGGSGTDTVISSITSLSGYTLPPNVENLTLIGKNSRSIMQGTGNELNNVITASAGGGTINGMAGNDTLMGGKGNDKLVGGLGADYLVGGLGKNVYIYKNAAESNVGGFDHIVGTFNGGLADKIQLVSSVNTLNIIPAQSAGVAESGLTVDVLNTLLSGTASTKFQSSKLNVAILTTTDSVPETFLAIDIDGDGAFTASDMLIDVTTNSAISITDLTFKITASSDQVIYGGTGVDVLIGGMGNDKIQDAGGSNTIDGGAGNDYITVNIDYWNGSTIVNATSGSSSISGGDGNDTIRSASGNDIISGGAGDDLITSTTSQGGMSNDTISGNDGNDTIQSSLGNDSISGGTGDDQITDWGGSNTIDGGDGNDYISTQSTTGDNSITGGVGNDTIQSGYGNDSISGGTGDDQITDRGGNNTIDGGDGNDHIFTSYSGNNTITGGSGNDNITSGSGNDTISGDDGDDRIYSGNGNDSISGGDGNDILYGGNGADTLVGGAGNNHYYFPNSYDSNISNGVDQIVGTFNGESGDLIHLPFIKGTLTVLASQSSGSTSSVLTISSLNALLNSSNGTASSKFPVGNTSVAIITTTDTTPRTFLAIDMSGDGYYGYEDMLIDVTNATRTSITASTFVGMAINGTTAADSITGTNFDDIITGFSGNDTIYAGSGDDQISGNEGNDYISGDDGNDSIDDYSGNNTLLGGNGDDTIYSSSGNDSISGGSGDDNITDGGGSNTIDGGDGDDMIDVNWWNVTASNTISGGNGNDSISGGSGSDTISGDAGDDNIYGGDGNNTIDGGDGNDDLQGGMGNDSIFGNNGDDNIGDAGGSNTLSGGDGNDTIGGGSGNDSILGGAGNDELDDYAGNNTLSGGDGNDTIYGGGGNDTISGDLGIDYLYGGDGNDTFIFVPNDNGAAPSATVFDTIADFGMDADTIDFSTAITIDPTTATAIAGTAQISNLGVATFNASDATLSQKIIAVEKAIESNTLTAGEAALFVSGYDSYIFISDTVAGVSANDVLIKLENVVSTNLTLSGGNITAVVTPYSVAGFSSAVSGLAESDTIYIADTAANISFNFSSVIIPNFAKIDRIYRTDSNPISLTAAQFSTQDVAYLLPAASVVIDLTGATSTQLEAIANYAPKIATGGLTNLSINNAATLSDDATYNLLGKATAATVVATGASDWEVKSFGQYAANIASITGDITLRWGYISAAETTALFSKYNGTTVTVNASGMDLGVLSAVSDNVSKVSSITNLQLYLLNQTDTETTNLLSKATGAYVNATGATTNEIASLVTSASHIGDGSIWTDNILKLTPAQFTVLASKLNASTATTIEFAINTAGQSIINFSSNDKIDLSALTFDTTVKPISGTMTPINGFVYLLATGNAGDADSVSAAAAAINAAAVLADSTATSYVVITDDNSSAIYKWVDAGGANGAASSELTLMATVNSVLSANNIVMAAAPTTITVSGAGTGTAVAGNFQFNFTSGTYNYTISGFGAGDVLNFPDNTATVINDNLTDNSVDVEWADGSSGNVVTVTLTGLTNDAALYTTESFNAAFGAGSLV